MKKLKIQLAVFLLGFAVIIISLCYLFVKPKYQSFKAYYHDILNNQARISYLSAKKQTLLQLSKEQERIKMGLEKSSVYIPTGKQLSEFIVQIEAACNQTGNKIKNFTIIEAKKKQSTSEEEEKLDNQQKKEKKAEPKKPYQTIEYSLIVEGGFKQLLDFLALTESLSRLTTFVGLHLSTSANNLIETRLEGEVYYR